MRTACPACGTSGSLAHALNDIGIAGLQVGNLVNVGVFAADHAARPEVARKRWPDMPVRRELEQRLGHHPFEHAHAAARSLVVVNRRALPVAPAQHPDVVPLARVDQIATISAVRELHVGRHVLDLDLQLRELSAQLRQRRAPMQRVKIGK